MIAGGKARQVLPLGALLPDPSAADDEDLVITGAEIAGGYVLVVLGDGAAVLLRHYASTGEDATITGGDCSADSIVSCCPTLRVLRMPALVLLIDNCTAVPLRSTLACVVTAQQMVAAVPGSCIAGPSSSCSHSQ